MRFSADGKILSIDRRRNALGEWVTTETPARRYSFDGKDLEIARGADITEDLIMPGWPEGRFRCEFTGNRLKLLSLSDEGVYTLQRADE